MSFFYSSITFFFDVTTNQKKSQQKQLHTKIFKLKKETTFVQVGRQVHTGEFLESPIMNLESEFKN